MGRINKIVCALFSGVLVAQNNTNSPYSRYGYGQLVDQGFGRNQAMGGVGYALRNNSQINPLNPAAYTAMDSLTFLFEGGVSFQNANFKEGGTKLNAKNSSLEYIAMQFRLKPWMSMSVGLLPISNIGYNVEQINTDTEHVDAQSLINRTGDGGLHKVYAGMGFIPMKNLSVGFNVGFIWGKLKRNTAVYFPNIPVGNDVKKSIHNTTVSLKGLDLNFGAQYQINLSKDKNITVGAYFAPKIKLHNEIDVVSFQNSLVNKNFKSKYDLAASYGLGVAYEFDKRLTVSADILYQKWSSAKYYDEVNVMSDLTKIGVGAEYLPSYYSRNYLAKIKYRAGAYFTNPYYKIDGIRASREYGFSAGLGLPLPQGKSQLNISAEFIRVNGQRSQFLDENIIRLNLGIVFNEGWFFKRKI